MTYTVQKGNFYSHNILFKKGNRVKPNKLEGTWDNYDDETFIVTSRTITYQLFGYPMFYGEIISVCDYDEEGYITFRYKKNCFDNNLADKYCVLHWDNFQHNCADIAIACRDFPGDTGEIFREAAEEEYNAAAAVNCCGLAETFYKSGA